MLLFLLPWQAIAAAERSFTHVMSSRAGGDLESVIKHMAEHDAHVLHHHDDDDDDGGDVHLDNSEKSIHHLNDYDQGCGLHVLLPAAAPLSVIVQPSLAPDSWPHTFSNRTTLPPLPPPRVRA